MTANVTIGLKRMEGADPDIPLPAYATEGAAGADMRADLSQSGREDIVLAPGERKLIPTGLIFEIPKGWEVQVRPRSGLALKHGVTLLNAPGTIDSDYRGEVGIILVNLGQAAFRIAHGDRVAQLVVTPAVQARFAQIGTVTSSDRGMGGFGSTGLG